MDIAGATHGAERLHEMTTDPLKYRCSCPVSAVPSIQSDSKWVLRSSFTVKVV